MQETRKANLIKPHHSQFVPNSSTTSLNCDAKKTIEVSENHLQRITQIKNNIFDNLIKTSFLSIAIRVVNTILVFFVGVLLARTLGPKEYGVYALVMSIIMVSAIPITAGMPNLFVREISRYKLEKKWNNIIRIFTWYIKAILVYSLLLVIGALFLKFDNNLLSSDIRETLLFGFILVPLLSIVLTQGASLRGLGKVVIGQVPSCIIAPALFLLFIVTTIYVGKLTPVIAIQLKIFSTAVAVLLSTIALMLLLKGKSYANDNDGATNCLYKSLLSLTLIGGFQVILDNTNILVLGLLCISEDVGVYKVAVQIANLVVFGLYSINQILHPQFAKYALCNSGDLQKLVKQSSKIILAIAIPPALVLSIAGAPLLGKLFGGSYATGGPVLRILALGQLINAAFGSVGALLNMSGNEKDTLKGMLIAVILNIVLSLGLVPILGIEGAAISTAISCLTWNVVLRRFVKKRLGIESCCWIPNIRNFASKHKS